jgi:hypothetical protein
MAGESSPNQEKTNTYYRVTVRDTANSSQAEEHAGWLTCSDQCVVIFPSGDGEKTTLTLTHKPGGTLTAYKLTKERNPKVTNLGGETPPGTKSNTSGVFGGDRAEVNFSGHFITIEVDPSPTSKPGTDGSVKRPSSMKSPPT